MTRSASLFAFPRQWQQQRSYTTVITSDKETTDVFFHSLAPPKVLVYCLRTKKETAGRSDEKVQVEVAALRVENQGKRRSIRKEFSGTHTTCQQNVSWLGTRRLVFVSLSQRVFLSQQSVSPQQGVSLLARCLSPSKVFLSEQSVSLPSKVFVSARVSLKLQGKLSTAHSQLLFPSILALSVSLSLSPSSPALCALWFVYD